MFPTAILIYLLNGSTLRLVLLHRQRWCNAIQWQMAHQPKPESTSAIRFRCAECRRTIREKIDAAGQTGKCPSCGHRLQIPETAPIASPAPTVRPGVEQTILKTGSPTTSDGPAVSHYDNGYLYPLYFPFTKNGWFKNLWCVSLLMFVPIVNVLLLRGWRLDLSSRVAAGETKLFPSASGIPKYLLKSIVLWFSTLTFTLFPMLLLSSLGIGGIIDTLGDIWTLLMIIFRQSEEKVISFLFDQGIEEVLCFLIASTWEIVSSPLYRARMIRLGYWPWIFLIYHCKA